MGRNGAGKSTLLRHAAGLMKPTRGRVRSAGRVALLLQNPNDYLVHELGRRRGVGGGAGARSAWTRPQLAERHPRELSGGESQRLALAIVLGDGADAGRRCCASTSRPGGWTASARRSWPRCCAALDAAVLVATHDPEFVAAFADRVVLLADGAPIADGPARRGPGRRQLLRHRDGADPRRRGGALTPAEGIAVLERAGGRGGRSA